MTRRDVGATARPTGRSPLPANDGIRPAGPGRARAALRISLLAATAAAGPCVAIVGAVTEPPWRIDRLSQSRPAGGGERRLRTDVAELRAALQARDAESHATLAQIDRTIAASNHRVAAALEDAQASSARMVARFEIFAAALIAVIAVLCAWMMRLQRQVQALERRRRDSPAVPARLAAAGSEPYAARADSSSSSSGPGGRAPAPPVACLVAPATRLPRGGPTTRPPARRTGRSD